MGCSISSRRESCERFGTFEESSTGNRQRCCNDTARKSLKETQFFEDLRSSSSYKEKDGFLSSEFVQALVAQKALPICETSQTSEHSFDYNQKDNIDVSYFSADAIINLTKHSSELLHSLSDSEDIVKYDEKSSEENLSCLQTPLASAVIPALKGYHSQTKSPTSAKLSVKWAPEVYDPPATSLSHTVKGNHYKQHHPSYKQHTHYHHSKPRKHHHGNKHTKEKSKKHAHRWGRRRI